MRIILRMMLIVIGLALAGGGVWAAAVGHAHSDKNYKYGSQYEVPGSKALIARVDTLLRKVPEEYRAPLRGHLKIDERGMLYPLGGSGALVAFLGLILFLNGVFRKWSKKEKETRIVKEEEARIDASMIPTRASAPQGAKADAISIDEGIIQDEEDPDELMRDINYLVTISQGAIETELATRVVRTFHPDLEKFLPLFNEPGVERFAKQILSSVVLRHRRHSKDITADQFQSQDARITECEREAFCHRYMPARAKITNDEIRDSAGKVYDTHARAEIQKRDSGEADDWMDVSLRNAAEVLSAKSPSETAA